MSTEIASLYVELAADFAPFYTGVDGALFKGNEIEAMRAELAKPILLGPVEQLGGGALAADAGAAGAAERDAGAAEQDAAATERNAVAHEHAAKAAEGHGSALGGLTGALGAVTGPLMIGGAAIAGIGALSLTSAGDFQELTTQLVTGAGESAANLEMVRQGLMAMAPQVGITADELAKGMYNIESAGYHGKAGLDVLKAAAEGAAVGGADMATVADGLTSAMNAYHTSGLSATQMTNDLVATVASGKMHMQDLASSLGTVLPAASTAHVSLQQVTAAIATMTAQGTPAADAATYLRQTILQLENPSAKATKALHDIGLSASDLHHMLGDPSIGLAGTLDAMTTRLGKKFPESAAAAAAEFAKVKSGAEDMDTAMANLAGSGGVSQQYISMLSDMVGGTKSMQAALELTGGNMTTFKGNIASISGAVADGKTQVSGFADVQGDFNFKMNAAKASLENMAIGIGDRLLPVAGKLADWFVNDGLPGLQSFGGWIGDNLIPALGQLGHWIGDNIVPSLEQFGRWFMDTGLPALEKFGGWIETNVLPPLGKLAGFVFQVGEMVVTKLGPPVMQFVQTIGPPLAQIFGFIGDKINILLPIIDAFLSQMAATNAFTAKVIGDIVGAFTWFADHVIQKIGDVVNFIGGFYGKVVGFFAGADRWLISAGTNIVVGLWNGISGFLNTFWDNLLRVPHGLWQFFSKAVTWLEDAGKAIVQGLINGIGDMAGALANKLGGLKDDVVGGIKSVFHISSPSQVMHDEVGVHLGAGIISGLTESVAGFKGSSLVSSLLGTFPSGSRATSGATLPTISSPGGGASMASVATMVPASGGSGPVTITNHFHIDGSKDPHTTAMEVRNTLLIMARQHGLSSLFGQFA